MVQLGNVDSGLELSANTAVPPPLLSALVALCNLIVPADGRSGSASEAGVPAFLCYLASVNEEYKRRLRGGLIWCNAYSTGRFCRAFAECMSDQQMAIVNDIAYRKAADKRPELEPGISFFAWLRRLVLSAFFTTQMGIDDLQYMGNQYVSEWNGCPDIPLEAWQTVGKGPEPLAYAPLRTRCAGVQQLLTEPRP